MTTLIYLQIPVPEPIPGDPVPDLRGYAPANFASMTTRIDCDRFFYPECFASRPTHEP